MSWKIQWQKMFSLIRIVQLIISKELTSMLQKNFQSEYGCTVVVQYEQKILLGSKSPNLKHSSQHAYRTIDKTSHPDLNLLNLKLSSDTVSPSFCQKIFGAGTPVARQGNVTSRSWTTRNSPWDCSIEGGTVECRKTEYKMRSWLQLLWSY